MDKIVANLLDYSTTETAKQKILHTESQQRSSMEQRTLAIQRLTFEGISADDRKQTVSDYIAAENKLAQLSNEHDLCAPSPSNMCLTENTVPQLPERSCCAQVDDSACISEPGDI